MTGSYSCTLKILMLSFVPSTVVWAKQARAVVQCPTDKAIKSPVMVWIPDGSEDECNGWDTAYVHDTCKVMGNAVAHKTLGAMLGPPPEIEAHFADVLAGVTDLHDRIEDIHDSAVELVLKGECAGGVLASVAVLQLASPALVARHNRVVTCVVPRAVALLECLVPSSGTGLRVVSFGRLVCGAALVPRILDCSGRRSTVSDGRECFYWHQP